MSDDFVVDFSDVEDTMKPIPEGEYLVVVTEATPGTSNSGNPKIDLRLTVEDGDHEGRVIFDTLSFHPKALWRTKRSLKQLGFPGDFKGSLSEIAADVEGTIATAVVSIEESTQTDESGEPYPPRNRIRRFASADVALEEIF